MIYSKKPNPSWKTINVAEVKKKYLDSLLDGWSPSVSKHKAKITDYGFRMLLKDDPDIKKANENYVKRKQDQSRHPSDRISQDQKDCK